MNPIRKNLLSLAARILIGLMACCAIANADIVKPTDEITVFGQTIYNTGNTAVPDSIRVRTMRAGVERFDAWYNEADAEADTAGGMLFFYDQFQDIDGAGGDGFYLVIVDAYDTDSALYTSRSWSFTVGTDVDADIFAILGDSGTAENLFELWQPDSIHAQMRIGHLETGNLNIEGQLSVTNLTGGPAVKLYTDSNTSAALLLQPGAGGVGIYVDETVIAQNFAGDRLFQLSDSAAAQGAASGLTAPEIIDTLFNRLVADTVTGSWLAQLIRDARTAADTTLWAQVDSITGPILSKIDSSIALAGNAGGMFSKMKYATDVDSLFLGFEGPPIDTVCAMVLYHPGAGNGAPPDSTKTIDWP